MHIPFGGDLGVFHVVKFIFFHRKGGIEMREVVFLGLTCYFGQDANNPRATFNDKGLQGISGCVVCWRVRPTVYQCWVGCHLHS